MVIVVVVVEEDVDNEEEVEELIVVVNLDFRFSISASTSFRRFNSLESHSSTSMKSISPTKLDQLD